MVIVENDGIVHSSWLWALDGNARKSVVVLVVTDTRANSKKIVPERCFLGKSHEIFFSQMIDFPTRI